jgi:3',5'-cyclic AMP phosphodiesterase CpdA
MGMLRRILLTVLGFLTLFSCTNLGLNQLNDRINDNFTGTIPAPADIDPAGTNSFTFMAVGDTHIGSPQGETLNEFAQFAKTANDAFIVVAGDLAHNGLEGEFVQFKQVMSNNTMAWRAAIGNHDIYFDGWSRYRSQIGRSVYSFNADNVHFVMLDSANGILGTTQMEWLENDLRSNTRTHIVIVSHFPPWNGAFSSIYRMSSEEEAAVLKDICFRYNVDLFISGHYHGYEEVNLGHTKYIVTGGANSQTDPGQRRNYVRVTVNGGSLSTEVVYPY